MIPSPSRECGRMIEGVKLTTEDLQLGQKTNNVDIYQIHSLLIAKKSSSL